jgi:streptogramin lyase
MNYHQGKMSVALFALGCLGLAAAAVPARAQFTQVEAPPAVGISIGPSGNMFLLGTDQTPAGYVLYRWDGQDWRPFPGAAVRLAVDSHGDPWAVTTDNRILHYADGQWVAMPGRATDVATGPDGSVWITGARMGRFGYPVYRWDGRNWSRVEREAVHLAVDPDGKPWVIDAQNAIYRFDGRDWQRMPASATEISIGANGSAWVLGTDMGPYGHGIYYWDGQNWDATGGMALALAVGPDGVAWVVNNQGALYQYTG